MLATASKKDKKKKKKTWTLSMNFKFRRVFSLRFSASLKSWNYFYVKSHKKQLEKHEKMLHCISWMPLVSHFFLQASKLLLFMIDLVLCGSVFGQIAAPARFVISRDYFFISATVQISVIKFASRFLRQSLLNFAARFFRRGDNFAFYQNIASLSARWTMGEFFSKHFVDRDSSEITFPAAQRHNDDGKDERKNESALRCWCRASVPMCNLSNCATKYRKIKNISSLKKINLCFSTKLNFRQRSPTRGWNRN